MKSANGGAVTLSTRPATLSELLGKAEADGQVPVDPNGIKVTPLVKDLKATVARENGTTTADASGTLEVDVKAPIPLPEGLSADASASVQLHPRCTSRTTARASAPRAPRRSASTWAPTPSGRSAATSAAAPAPPRSACRSPSSRPARS
ncbi:hypothetical protein ACFQ0M_34765 [Kitasatospora aburaviensis]